MDQGAYERLVRRCENEALHDAGRFRAKVVLISAAAYAFLAVLLGTLAVIAVMGFVYARENHLHWVAFKLALVGLALAVIVFVVLRAFLTRIPPPDGHALASDDAPRLFQLLENVRRRVGGPPLDRVVVTRDFNAAIAQVPRFGLFGGHRNHLVLGLPFLESMNTTEMTAVLAHEYAHLAEAHGKLGSWVYRQRATFGTLMARLARRAEESALDRALLAVIARFAPYFNACTFALARQQEFEADQTAARVAGTEAAANSLCRAALLGEWLERYHWPGVYALAADHPAPPCLPYSGLATAIAQGFPDWASPTALARACQVRSDVEDTHPCLDERLASIGERPRLPPPLERSAAKTLLGRQAARLARELDAEWWEEMGPRWQAHHRRCEADRAIIARLDQGDADVLAPTELHQLAGALARHGRSDAALTILERLVARPDGPFPRSLLLFGTLLLEAGDPRGLEHLRAAAAAEPRLAGECATRGHHFLLRREGEHAASMWAGAVAQAAPG